MSEKYIQALSAFDRECPKPRGTKTPQVVYPMPSSDRPPKQSHQALPPPPAVTRSPQPQLRKLTVIAFTHVSADRP